MESKKERRSFIRNADDPVYSLTIDFEVVRKGTSVRTAGFGSFAFSPRAFVSLS
jgi:hypothetical protein